MVQGRSNRLGSTGNRGSRAAQDRCSVIVVGIGVLTPWWSMSFGRFLRRGYFRKLESAMYRMVLMTTLSLCLASACVVRTHSSASGTTVFSLGGSDESRAYPSRP